MHHRRDSAIQAIKTALGTCLLLFHLCAAEAGVQYNGSYSYSPSIYGGNYTYSSGWFRLGAAGGSTGTLTVDTGTDVYFRYGYLGYATNSTGIATITGNSSSWANYYGSELYLGYGVGARGTLNIQDGAQANSRYGYVGYNSNSIGTVTVTGPGSKWTSSSELHVGRSGAGTLNVSDGGLLTSYYGYVGFYSNSNGTVTVTGSGSQWNNTHVVYVGNYGTGAINVSDGGLVTNYFGIAGNNLNSTGTISVTGAGSHWKTSGNFILGNSGNGILNLMNGGLVTSSSSNVGSGTNSTGTATITGDGSQWAIAGDLYVGRAGTGSVEISAGGTVEIGTTSAARDLHLGYTASGNGTVTVDEDGVLRLHGGDITQGDGTAEFNFDGGRLEGVATFNVGPGLTQDGGVLAPGNSPGVTTIIGDYLLNAGALEIELDGSAGAGIVGGHDQLVVNGIVSLGSSAVVDLKLSFAPTVGQEFLLVDNDGSDSVTGFFANGTTLAATFAGQVYQFAISYTAGDGNDIGVAAVPEASAFLCVGLVLSLTGTCHGRRRRRLHRGSRRFDDERG